MANIPEGYQPLAYIGIAYDGEYEQGKQYKYLHSVYHDGSTYIALVDNPIIPPVNDNANWRYLAHGFPITETVSGVKGNNEQEYRHGNVNITPENIGAINETEKGSSGGVATLDGSGKIPDEQMPDSVEIAIDASFNDSKAYTDQKIADAMQEHEEVVDALELAIGNKLDKNGDSKDNTVTFTSADELEPTSLVDIDLVQSNETHSLLFKKFSELVKNNRFYKKLFGNTDISSIADGTVTGAISELNGNIEGKEVILFSGNAALNSSIAWNETLPFEYFHKITIDMVFQERHHAVDFFNISQNNQRFLHSFGWSDYNASDGLSRIIAGCLKFSGRYITDIFVTMSVSLTAFTKLDVSKIIVASIVGYR